MRGRAATVSPRVIARVGHSVGRCAVRQSVALGTSAGFRRVRAVVVSGLAAAGIGSTTRALGLVRGPRAPWGGARQASSQRLTLRTSAVVAAPPTSGDPRVLIRSL